jgi:hypothetical protein
VGADILARTRIAPTGSARVAAATALVALALAIPAVAGAATYASPTGSGTECSIASPCLITEAVNNSVGGSPVVLLFGANGQYGSAGTPIATALKPKPNVTVEGEAGRPRPTVHINKALDFTAGGIHVDHVGFVAYDPGGSGLGLLNGSANDIFVHASGNTGSACMLNGISTITNSVCQADQANYVALYTNNSSASTDDVTARNVTLYATSPTQGVGAFADAENASAVVHMTLIDVIARGADADVDVQTGIPGAVATLDVTHSNYKKAVASAATLNDNGGNQTTVDPIFSDGSYHQAPGSPTIDAGVNDPANGAADFDGDPRSLGSGVTDIGADEFVPAPLVATLDATAVGPTIATLNGTVNPESRDTTYHFDFGTTTAYGLSTPDTGVGSGFAPIGVNAPLNPIVSGTTYHFRIVATNNAGTSFGVDRQFTTLAAAGIAAPGPFGGIALLLQTARADRKGNVLLDVTCPATAVGNCVGTDTLTTAGKVKVKLLAAKSKKKKAKILKLGSARFSVPPGTKLRLKIKLSKTALKLLKQKKTLKAIQTVVAHDSRNVNKTSKTRITLKAPKAKKRKKR